jgi:hypothetical protein
MFGSKPGPFSAIALDEVPELKIAAQEVAEIALADEEFAERIALLVRTESESEEKGTYCRFGGCWFVIELGARRAPSTFLAYQGWKRSWTGRRAPYKHIAGPARSREHGSDQPGPGGHRGETIKHYLPLIRNTLDHELSNARAEATNTHLRVLTRRAYGFHTPQALISMAMLTRGKLFPPLPGRS